MMKDSDKVKHTDETLRAMFKQANGVPIEFVAVENATYVDLDVYAAVLFQVGTIDESAHEHKEGEVHDENAERGKSYSLVSFKGTGGRNNPNRWHVDNIVYPYVPASYVLPEAKPGGDHGHDH
jgi:hypothetical protein